MPSTEMYRWYKAHGICVTCGREDAMIGHVRCFDCLEKERDYSRQYCQSDEHKAKKKQSDIRRTGERKSKGQCIVCGRMAVQGKIRCQLHLSKDARNHRHVGWKPSEECLYCSEQRVADKKLCEKHLLIAQKSIANVRKNINKKEHPWRQELFGKIG